MNCHDEWKPHIFTKLLCRVGWFNLSDYYCHNDDVKKPQHYL